MPLVHTYMAQHTRSEKARAHWWKMRPIHTSVVTDRVCVYMVIGKAQHSFLGVGRLHAINTGSMQLRETQAGRQQQEYNIHT